MSPYLSVNPRQRLLSNVKHLIHNLRPNESKAPEPAPKQADATVSDLEYNFKLRRIVTPEAAIELAKEELDILADLLEAHFVSHFESERQLKAIRLARDLADRFSGKNTISAIQELITIDFDRLSQIMLTLKNHNLTTSNHILWSDIMRPSVRVISFSLQRYLRLVASIGFDPETQVMSKTEKLNITYTSAQKQALADALDEEFA